MTPEAIPIVAEPDQRYWWSRANRRVRKARLTRTLRRWSAFGVALTIIGAALFQAGSHAVERFKQGGGFAVEHIEVEGALRGGEASIRERLAVACTRGAHRAHGMLGGLSAAPSR